MMTPTDVISLIARSTIWPDRPSPWSLSELRLERQFRLRLVNWCKSLTVSDLERVAAGLAEPVEVAGERVTGREAYGISLLLAFSEIARREASEGRLWSHVRRAISAAPHQRHALFDAGGQPAAISKLLLERGARRFGVRHAFDLVDHDGSGHHWYTTVFLQFGITRRGFERNATYWLRNQNLSRTIRLLLDRNGAATGAGKSLFSPDFERLWTNLLLGARKNLGGVGLRKALKASFWLPSEDCDDIAGTLERLDWSALSEDQIGDLDLDTDPVVDSFIGSVQWTLFDHGPGVAIELSGLASLELEAPYYDIVIDGRRVARLIRADESLRLLTLPNHEMPGATFTIRLPDPLRPVVRAALLDPSGATRAAQDLQLWSVDNAVTTKELKRVGSNGMRDSRNLLIADSSIRVYPADTEQFPLDSDRFFGVLVKADPNSEIELKLGDSVLWPEERKLSTQVSSRVPPISASLTSVAGGDAATKILSISLTAAESVELTDVWHGTQRLELVRRSTSSASIELNVPAVCHEVSLVVVVNSAPLGMIVRRVRIETPVSGFFRIRNGKMERSESTRFITKASVAEGRYVFLPERKDETAGWSRAEWTLYEGPRPLGRMPLRGQPRLAPFGLGWPLSAQYRPVNREESRQLCGGVVDFGDLRATHDLNPLEDGAISLGLHDSLIDQLDEYSLVIWDCSGRLVGGEILDVAESSRGYTTILGLPSEPIESPVAIGLNYRGFRAGAVWRRDWTDFVRGLAGKGQVRAASIMRWLHLPVATTDATAAIRCTFLDDHAIALIRGFSSGGRIETDDGSRSLLVVEAGAQQPGALDTPWYYAIRDLIDDWIPAEGSVETFIDASIEGIPQGVLEPTPLVAGLDYLSRISPRLALGTAIRYASINGGRAMRMRVLSDFASHIAESGSDSELAASEVRLREQAANTLGSILRRPIDPMFVRGLVEAATAPDGWLGTAWSASSAYPRSRSCDSRLLCQFPDGRRLLTIRGAILARRE